MKIDLANLKKLATSVPELRIADLVAILSTVVEIERNETERTRLANKRQQSATSANNDQQTSTPPTQADLERALFADGKAILGRNANGMVAALLKAHRYQASEVRAVLTAAGAKGDPRGYVAAILRRAQNGTGTSLMDAFDKLDDRAAGAAFGAGPEIRDITPGSDQGG